MIRKIFDYLIAIFVTGCSMFYIPSRTFGDSQIDFFKIGACLIFGISLFLEPIRKCCNYYLNFIFLLALYLLITSGREAQFVGITPFVNLFLAITTFYVVANYLQDRKLIYKGMAIAVVVNFIMVMAQYFNMDPLCLNDLGKQNSHLVGFFGFKMNLGAYAAMSAPLIFLINPILGVMAVLLTFASKSWGAVLAAGIAFLYYSKNISKKLFMVSISAIILISSIAVILYIRMPDKGFINSKFYNRAKISGPMISVALRSPYRGYGLGSVPFITHELHSEINKDGNNIGEIPEIWNDYLEITVMLGFGALALLLLMIRSVFRKIENSLFLTRDREFIAIGSSLLTIAIGMLLHSYINFPNIAVPSLVVLALFTIKQKEMEK